MGNELSQQCCKCVQPNDHHHQKWQKQMQVFQSYSPAPDLHLRGSNASSKEICIKDFEQLEVIGRGYMSKVVLAQHRHNHRYYAIKIYRKDQISTKQQIRRVHNEKTLLQALDHPGIVKLQFSFQSQHKLYLATHFQQGGELYSRVRHIRDKEQRQVTEQEILFYAAHLLNILEYLHSINIIYRDLKPENVLLTSSGHIKLIDFGFSKRLAKNERRTRSVCGTVQYMAPEMILGQDYDHSVDLWALGMLLVFMLRGDTPFYLDGDKLTHKQIKTKIVNDQITLPSSCSPSLRDLIAKLVAPLSHRLSSVEQVMAHPFFRGVQAHLLPIPFVPTLNGPADTSYVDPSFRHQRVVDTPVKDVQLAFENFENFTYMDPSDQPVWRSGSPLVIDPLFVEHDNLDDYDMLKGDQDDPPA